MTRALVSIVLALTVIAAGCGVTQPPSTPPPAAISGHVIIAEKVRAATAIAVPPRDESDIFWVIEVSVKNVGYNAPIDADLGTWYQGWEINANGEVFRPRLSGVNNPLSVGPGDTSQFTFYFAVPRSLDISDARIWYKGQDPYSCGSLTGGDKVEAYDLNSNRVIEEAQASEQYFVKREITGWRTAGKIGDVDIPEPVYEDVYMELKTIGEWGKETYGSSEIILNDGLGKPHTFWLIEFKADKSPWVANWYYEPRELSPLDPLDYEVYLSFVIRKRADFDDYFWGGNRGFFLGWFWGWCPESRGVSDKQVHSVVGDEAGDFVVIMQPTAAEDIVNWWVKVGVE